MAMKEEIGPLSSSKVCPYAVFNLNRVIFSLWAIRALQKICRAAQLNFPWLPMAQGQTSAGEVLVYLLLILFFSAQLLPAFYSICRATV